jgi:molecular chaperone DnaK (HSP70)
MGKPREQFQREFNGKVYSAEELSGLILRKLKADAEKYLKEPVTDAVITVPAYFNDAERTATITAGQLAGLNVLQIINEPTAAAVAYGLDKLDEDQTVFVFDLGGGTFDVTIMRIEGHGIQMLATNGDHRLGGKDWDDVIVNHVAEEFDREHGENPLLDLQSYQDLQSRALAAKIQGSRAGHGRPSFTPQRQEREGGADPAGIRKDTAPRREVQDDLRNGAPGSGDGMERHQQGSPRGRHDADADGARNGGQPFARAAGG